MNVFDKIKQTIIADLQATLDKKEQKDPIISLNNYIRRYENETKEAWKLFERQYQLKNELYREWQYAQYMAEKRAKQYEIAQTAEESELKVLAETEQLQYEEQSERFKKSYERAVKQLNQLELDYKEMESKLTDMKIKRLKLMGQENSTRNKEKLSSDFYNKEESNSSTILSEIEHFFNNIDSCFNSKLDKNMIDYKLSQLEKQFQQKQ